jgi:hypothetical protein
VLPVYAGAERYGSGDASPLVRLKGPMRTACPHWWPDRSSRTSRCGSGFRKSAEGSAYDILVAEDDASEHTTSKASAAFNVAHARSTTTEKHSVTAIFRCKGDAGTEETAAVTPGALGPDAGPDPRAPQGGYKFEQ